MSSRLYRFANAPIDSIVRAFDAITRIFPVSIFPANPIFTHSILPSAFKLPAPSVAHAAGIRPCRITFVRLLRSLCASLCAPSVNFQRRKFLHSAALYEKNVRQNASKIAAILIKF
jgi:hypothetical protein